MRNNLQHVWGDNPEQRAVLTHYEQELGRWPRWRKQLRLKCGMLAWQLVILSTLAFKRLLDIVVALAAVVLLAPLLLLTILAIKLEDPGPALFVQRRVGQGGRVFPMYKFRSMVVNAEALKAALAQANESGAGVLFKMRNDPRVTRVGRIIRKLSIDELPQIFNVLRGDMSIVGPRPALPREVEQYSQEERVRLGIKPGITCLWQIGGRSDIDFHGQVRLDLQYIRSQSLWQDLQIILKTIPVVLLGKGAY
jgi:exopolysaccharide biosynthesis polyprenyl glycosylphosphotransferase